MNTKSKKPHRYWTKENCQKEALKYNSRTEFKKNSIGAYDKARDNNWVNEICSHMTGGKKHNGYWTKDKCQIEALKYKSRSEFKKNSPSAFNSSKRNKWLNQMCSHMKLIGDKFRRLVYVYEFCD